MGADLFQDLAEDDLVLYNDKKEPLRVTRVEDDRVFVEGPHGGSYVLFQAPDDPELVLVSTPGNRDYASRVEELRTVGSWERAEDTWEHTETGATIHLERTEAGFWTVRADGVDADVPKYGFTERKIAEKEARKLVSRNPEG